MSDSILIESLESEKYCAYCLSKISLVYVPFLKAFVCKKCLKEIIDDLLQVYLSEFSDCKCKRN